mgnify:CR=1 FL=1
MSYIRREVTYFSQPGPQNTDEVLRLARKRAEELGIRDIVVASTSGETGVKASEVFKGFNLVVVSHSTGFKKPGEQRMSEENRRRIIENGGKVITGTEVFLGVGRAIRDRFGTAYPTEIMAQTLRLFGQGTKVAVEITAMAADAGLIPVDRDVIAIGGTRSGADTALVIKPANSLRIFDMVVREVIAKPRAV